MPDIDIQPDDQAVFDRLKSTGRITHGLRRVMTQQWNQCVNCGSQIARCRPAFAGYTYDGSPKFVGACCAHELSELATPVYWTGTLNLSVSDSQPTWRYMDFARFVAMLQQRGLHFSRADQFDDPFEGATGLERRKALWENHYLDFFRRAVTTPPPGFEAKSQPAEKIEEAAQRLLRSLEGISLEWRNLLLSCWHGGGDESEALWRLYCPPPTLGVAIKTTIGRLWDATAQERSAMVGRVHYVDFKSSFASIQKERIFCKRRSLSHENEIRVVLDNNKSDPVRGRTMCCDLSALVQVVVVSPFAPPWCKDVVSNTIKQYGYELEVRQSELLDPPFY